MFALTRSMALAGAALALAAAPAAAQKVTFTLNWVAGGDHAPYFYAQKMGWYKQAGIDVEFETGRGSAVSAQKVGAGATQLGLSDMAVVLNARGKGARRYGGRARLYGARRRRACYEGDFLSTTRVAGSKRGELPVQAVESRARGHRHQRQHRQCAAAAA